MTSLGCRLVPGFYRCENVTMPGQRMISSLGFSSWKLGLDILHAFGMELFGVSESEIERSLADLIEPSVDQT